MGSDKSIFCPNCGKSISSDFSFCPYCSAQVQIQSTASEGSSENIKPKKEKPPKIKRKLKKSTVIIIGSVTLSALVVAAIIAFLSSIVIPNIELKANFENANSAFEEGRYDEAISYYEKSDESYIDEETNYKINYAKAVVLFEENDFRRAADMFNITNNLLDSDEYILKCGNNLFEEKDYLNASIVYGMLDSDEATAMFHYAKGLKDYGYNNHKAAIKSLLIARKSIEEVDDVLPEVYYAYGKSLFEDEEYEEAAAQFESAGDYLDAASFTSNSKFMQAETYFDEHDYKKAKEIYEALPKDFEYSGIKASDRLNIIKAYSDIEQYCGTWEATSANVTARDIYKDTGSWDEWTISELVPNQYVYIDSEIEPDGSITLSGTVYYWVFTKYSVLSEYCKSAMAKNSFEIKNADCIPSEIEIDEYTTLYYNNDNFRLEYYRRDDYSVHFYYAYASTVSYSR